MRLNLRFNLIWKLVRIRIAKIRVHRMCFGLPIDPIRAESFTAEMPGSWSGAGSETAEIESQPLTAESAEIAEKSECFSMLDKLQPIRIPDIKADDLSLSYFPPLRSRRTLR
jgi:hypothetical protein